MLIFRAVTSTGCRTRASGSSTGNFFTGGVLIFRIMAERQTREIAAISGWTELAQEIDCSQASS